jgi:hypothetical protein
MQGKFHTSKQITTMSIINSEISARIQATSPRSAWSKGVKLYALELLESLESDCTGYTSAALLNGAENWRSFSYGGGSLIYDADIAERLATASELKRKKGGDLPPSASETWLDCQARALSQAACLISKLSR